MSKMTKTADYSISEEDWIMIQKDPGVRRAICRKNPFVFFHLYFHEYIKAPTADFHRELFHIMGDQDLDLGVVVAFRGSGKSTILNMANVIWSIVGEPQKKFAVVFGLRQQQADLYLSNIRDELENNVLLNKDFGPFYSSDAEWSSSNLVIKKYGARIKAASVGESVRGIRSGADRPDLIICDDVEDLDTVSTQEGRDKTYNRFNGTIRPLGDTNTKIIVVGNLLHEDSLIMKLKASIENNKSDSSLFRAYPLIDDDGKCLWSEKYPDEKSIKDLRSGMNDSSWLREYLLKIVPEGERVIDPGWLHHYETFPTDNERYRFLFILCSIDPAISEKATADYTSIVQAGVYKDTSDNSLKVYIFPDPINERLSFPDAVKRILDEDQYIRSNGLMSKWIAEDVAFQKSLIQQLEKEGLQVEGVRSNKGSKRERLVQSSFLIKSGNILFPQEGVDLLKAQITGYGIEKHDDLCDALTQMILYLTENQKKFFQPECIIMQGGDFYSGKRRAFRSSQGFEYFMDGAYTYMENGQIMHGNAW